MSNDHPIPNQKNVLLSGTFYTYRSVLIRTIQISLGTLDLSTDTVCYLEIEVTIILDTRLHSFHTAPSPALVFLRRSELQSPLSSQSLQLPRLKETPDFPDRRSLKPRTPSNHQCRGSKLTISTENISSHPRRVVSCF